MSTIALTVGWSVAGKVGERYCPAHRPDPGQVELLPITYANAKEADLRCSTCDELLARSASPMRTGGKYAT